jgi:hypothetical protein
MRGQHLANFLSRLYQRVAEFFTLKMGAHTIDNVLPKLLTALFVNRFVADNSEFVHAWRYENQHRIALGGVVHSEALKFLLSNDQRIHIQFSALNKNANLARGFGFGFSNRTYNPVVFKLGEKLSRAHLTTNSIPRLRRRNSRLPH